MPAPTPTVRQTPAGRFLEDGYQSLFTLETDPDIELWEKEVTPPPAMGGDPIDVTTQHNSELRTKAARELIDFGEATGTCAYDPVMYTRIRSQINREQTITQKFPDGSTLAFFGYLQNFEPSGLVEGEFPEASYTIVVTNRDPSDKSEQWPVLTNVTGT